MNKNTWRAMVHAIKGGHVDAMRHGLVLKPQLHAFVAGRYRGYAELRPVHRGRDAGTAIAELSGFAAAARADEIIAVWETQDLAIACDLPAREPEPGLNILYATPQQRRLHTYNYREHITGVAAPGLASVTPRWTSSGIPHTETLLEPPITALCQFSFQPLDSDDDHLLEHWATLLQAQGYRVRLAA